MVGRQKPEEADGGDGGNDGHGHVQPLLEVGCHEGGHGGGAGRRVEPLLPGTGEKGALSRLLLGSLARVVAVGHGGQRPEARRHGRDGESDGHGDPEEGAPLFHEPQRLGDDEHEGGRNGGESRGDDGRFTGRILALTVDVVGDDQAHRVAADERGDGVDGRAARCPEDGSHDGRHEDSGEFQEAEADEEGQEERPDGDDEPDGNGQLGEEKGADAGIEEPGGTDLEVDHGTDDGSGDFCEGEDEVRRRPVPGLAEEGGRRSGDHDGYGVKGRCPGQAVSDGRDDVIDGDGRVPAESQGEEEHEETEETQPQKTGQSHAGTDCRGSAFVRRQGESSLNDEVCRCAGKKGRKEDDGWKRAVERGRASFFHLGRPERPSVSPGLPSEASRCKNPTSLPQEIDGYERPMILLREGRLGVCRTSLKKG